MTRKSITHTFILLVVFFSITSCSKDSILPSDLESQLVGRSCSIVSNSWIQQLKSIGATTFSISTNEIEVSVVKKITASTYNYHAPNEIIGQNINDPTSTLFLITHNGFGGNIIGYYDPNNLDLCGSSQSNQIIFGEVGDIVFTSLGILGVDEDTF